MNIAMLVRCFLVGVSAASGVGPIFLLTLNRATLYGFWKGFATALGAALADSCYFALAMLGALNLLEQSKTTLLILEGFGGAALILFGLYLFRRPKQVTTDALVADEHFLKTTTRAFLLTLLSPFVLLFFMFVSVHILPAGITKLKHPDVALGSLVVGAGSLAVLSLLAALGAFMGAAIKRDYIEKFSKATALIFMVLGGGIALDFCIKFFK